MNETALAGTTVLELGEGIAVAYCGKLLAQFGARVVKLEPPAGDATRRAGPFASGIPRTDASGLFLYLNTSKQSVTLDLDTGDGRALLRCMLPRADIVIEALPPGRLDALGLGYEQVRALAPRVVMVSVTAFGQDGPYRSYVATDIVSHSVGGWLYPGGQPLREPLKPGGKLAEYTTGLVAAVGTMTALVHRNERGVGQHVDVSSMEALLSTLPLPTLRFSMTGAEWQRSGHRYPFTIMACKDGYIGLNILTQRQWVAMCQFMGFADWLEDARFASGPLRAQPEVAAEIVARVSAWLSDHTQAEIMAGQRDRIPFAQLLTTAELPDAAQYLDRDYFVTVDQPGVGPTRQPGLPFKLSEASPAAVTPAPTLGQHNPEVFEELAGCNRDALVALSRSGTI